MSRLCVVGLSAVLLLTPHIVGAAQTAPPARVFGSDSGLVLNFIKPDKTADFEQVMEKLHQALQKSTRPERRQQAASWRVFRAAEPAGANVLYVFIIDPAVKGADYTVSTILAEAFPDEVATLYKKYADAYATGQNVINLKLVDALGTGSSEITGPSGSEEPLASGVPHP